MIKQFQNIIIFLNSQKIEGWDEILIHNSNYQTINK